MLENFGRTGYPLGSGNATENGKRRPAGQWRTGKLSRSVLIAMYYEPLKEWDASRLGRRQLHGIGQFHQGPAACQGPDDLWRQFTNPDPRISSDQLSLLATHQDARRLADTRRGGKPTWKGRGPALVSALTRRRTPEVAAGCLMGRQSARRRPVNPPPLFFSEVFSQGSLQSFDPLRRSDRTFGALLPLVVPPERGIE